MGIMTKTHAELLACPRCNKSAEITSCLAFNKEGKQQKYNVICKGDCHLPKLTEEEAIKSWNTRINKEAEFLEELKRYIDKENSGSEKFCLSISFFDGLCYAYREILNKIEQFQAEQKQVSDEH